MEQSVRAYRENKDNYKVLSRFPHVKREHLHVHCNIKTM